MATLDDIGGIGSLFGLNPTTLNAQREQQYMDFASKVANAEAVRPGTGSVLGANVMGARGVQQLGSMFGIESPEDKLAKLRQQAMQQFGTQTPQGLAQAAQFLNQNGDAAGARQAVMAAQAQQQQLANLEKTKAQTTQAEAQGAAAEAGKLIQVDAGDKILIMNALTKKIVREIPKGATAAQTAKIEAADAQKKEVASTLLDSAVEGKTLVSNIEKQVGYNTVGVGSALSWVPMTEAKKFSADLSTLKSQLTLAAMNAAKSQSKTGATGFGALNSKELKVLQDNIAALDTGLSPEDFKSKLGEVTKYFNKLEQKATGMLQPPGTNTPETGEFADDYAKYKAKYGNQAMPYNAYVAKRKG